MSIMQSVSYRDRSLSRERTSLAYTQELRTGVNGISDYPPNILRVEVMFILRNVSLIGYVSGVTGLKRTCCSCNRFSMSRDHYLKIINQDGFRIIHLNLASWILQRIIWRLYLENPNWNLQQNILKKYQIRTPSGSSGFPEVFLQKQSTGTPSDHR